MCWLTRLTRQALVSTGFVLAILCILAFPCEDVAAPVLAIMCIMVLPCEDIAAPAVLRRVLAVCSVAVALVILCCGGAGDAGILSPPRAVGCVRVCGFAAVAAAAGVGALFVFVRALVFVCRWGGGVGLGARPPTRGPVRLRGGGSAAVFPLGCGLGTLSPLLFRLLFGGEAALPAGSRGFSVVVRVRVSIVLACSLLA